MKERIAWIDTAKAFAIFFIVLGHTLRSGAVQQYLLGFHVPLFFLLAGCVFSAKNNGFASFLKTKLRMVYAPYLIWGLASILIFQFFGDTAGNALGVSTERDQNVWISLLALLYGNTSVLSLKFNLPLWFLPCLFLMQTMFYPIDRHFGKSGRKMAAVTAVLFVLAACNQLLLKIRGLPFNGENALFMSGFFALGMCMRHLPVYRAPRAAGRILEPAAGAALIGIGVWAGLCNSHIAYSWSIYGQYPYFMVSSLCGSIGWILLLRTLPPIRPLLYMGRRTLPILVMHKFPIVFFQTLVPVVREYLAADHIAAALGVSAVTTLMCLAVSAAAERVFPVCIGMRKKD